MKYKINIPLFELYNFPFRLNEESDVNNSVLRMDFVIPDQNDITCIDIGKSLYYQKHKSEINIMIICSPKGIKYSHPFIGFFEKLLPELTYQL